MFTAYLLRRSTHSISRPLPLRLQASGLVRRVLRSPQWRLQLPSRRLESTAARQASTRQPPVYPEYLNVFLASPLMTAAAGTTRVATIGLFLFGLLIMGPGCYYNADVSNWWVGPAVLCSAIPLAVVHLIGAPFVSSIRVVLPSNVRHSKEALMRFANNTPPHTEVRIQFIRFVPWIQSKQVDFSDLRILPPSRIRLSNLEHAPPNAALQSRKDTYSGWFRKQYFERFWITMSQTIDRSRAPGVWAKMWQQIPQAGRHSREMEGKLLRKAGSMANRVTPVENSRRKPRPILRSKK